MLVVATFSSDIQVSCFCDVSLCYTFNPVLAFFVWSQDCKN